MGDPPISIGKDAFTTFGVPPDAFAWAALAAACVSFALATARPAWLASTCTRSPRAVLTALAASAAALSAGYICYYLRGAPRIIDATSYWLEARALSLGHFAFPIPWPSGAFRGRFLVTPPHEQALSVIFPPGWPAVLAIGFLLRAPLAVGPVLAALLVLATYRLSFALFARRDLALAAALLSTLCAALRYHTADTMSHGLSALLFCTALCAALCNSSAAAMVAGLACGWLLATRPVSGVALLLVIGFLLMQRRPAQRAAPFALGLVPGLALLIVHQRAATGAWLVSSQSYYYSLADGPPGCFRYGFGAGIGCMHEHGDVVRTSLAHGFHAGIALKTSIQRVLLNWIDMANAEPFAVLLLLGVFRGRRIFGVRLLAGSALLLGLAYAPFYFPGSYPGGGARLLAEALPLEHVLLAWAAAQLGVTRYLAPLACAGFALHTSYAHAALADREGGRPMFEAATLERAHVVHGLVFVNTDHAFNLGYVPGADVRKELVVARANGDAHDALLWNQLGRPPAYRYRYDPSGKAAQGIRPYTPELESPLRFEAEAEWPPLAVESGWALPGYRSERCASGGRGLWLYTNNLAPARVVLEVPVPRDATYRVRLGWVVEPRAGVHGMASLTGVRWDFETERAPSSCRQEESEPIRLRAGPQRLTLTITAPGAFLDFVELAVIN